MLAGFQCFKRFFLPATEGDGVKDGKWGKMLFFLFFFLFFLLVLFRFSVSKKKEKEGIKKKINWLPLVLYLPSGFSLVLERCHSSSSSVSSSRSSSSSSPRSSLYSCFLLEASHNKSSPSYFSFNVVGKSLGLFKCVLAQEQESLPDTPDTGEAPEGYFGDAFFFSLMNHRSSSNEKIHLSASRRCTRNS